MGVAGKGLHGDKLGRVVDVRSSDLRTVLRKEHIDFLKQRWSERTVLLVVQRDI